jgi:HEAT repeat protein
VLDLDAVRQQSDSNPHIALITQSFLLKATLDANDLVRFRATQSLRYYASEKPTVNRLTELTRDVEEAVRKKACWAMSYSTLPEARKALQKLAQEKNNSAGVRLEARKAIRRWEFLQAQRSGKTTGLFQE